ncbi:restriction endonuclease subunit S [Acinetobacter venetianus]|uniref:restriction endonuclease subunit S n=1 Tax=Acinetobacter venetianus TaxID=52133 RepID=UPI00036089BF|nr:restriction endonuclease subunit S [Acinetobacter venetianus]
MTVPKLRFKEFDGDWQNSILSKLSIKITDGTHDTPLVQKEGVPFLTAVNVKDGFINYDDIGFVDEITHRKIYDRCNPEKDDLLIVNIGAGTATCARNIVDYQFSLKNVALIKPNKKLLNPIFLEQIQRYNSTRLFTSLTSGGAQPFLSLKELGKLSISYPSLQEQTKIASFLSAVDEKISQLTQKHELLSQYKQGMMQKLFSQQIRFKADDGSEFGEWEQTLLSEFLTESLIKGLKGNEAKKLTVKLWGKGVVPKNEVFEGSENTQYYKRFVGQLIYGKLDFLNCAFGIIPTHLDGYETTIDAPSFDINKEKANPYFLLNRFLQKDFYKKNGEEADGSRKAKRINQSVFLAMQIDLPCLAEQTKIANLLSAIDQKIEVVAQQIEQAKQWKKGLLQQMFV